jgi:hypothetical protein
MKATRLTDHRKIEFTETDVINPKEKECLIKVKEVSVCGTDTRREFDKFFSERLISFASRYSSPSEGIVKIALKVSYLI